MFFWYLLESSQWHTVLRGVPQESVLGPILFAYINTLIEVVDNSELFLFADDNKLFNDISKTRTQKYYKKVLKQYLTGQKTHHCFFTWINVL